MARPDSRDRREATDHELPPGGMDSRGEAEEGLVPGAEAPRSENLDAPSPEPPPEVVEDQSHLERLQRLQAEFANYRRRVLREKAEWDVRAKSEILTVLLPILDDVERARSALRGAASDDAAQGLILILARLEESLRAAGLERQSTPRGTPFDPDQHEALLTEPDAEHPEGTILETLQPGYLYRGLLLRPARVMVSRAP